jgi:bifunctional DNase/RNase
MDRSDVNAHYLHLRELGGRRWLGIYCEWIETAVVLSSVRTLSPHRPFMHDTLITAVLSLEGEVEYVLIRDFVEDGQYFVAEIVIGGPNGRESVDSRPSDAIAVAVRAKVPIFVAEKLLKDGRKLDSIVDG